MNFVKLRILKASKVLKSWKGSKSSKVLKSSKGSNGSKASKASKASNPLKPSKASKTRKAKTRKKKLGSGFYEIKSKKEIIF